MKQTENKIKNAFTAITPDILETVVSDSVSGKGTAMLVKQKRRLPIAIVAAAAAFVMLFGVLAGVLVYTGNNAVASVVSIDVNPSIEMKLNKKDVVVEIKALNEDGQKILGNMDLVGTDVEVALNALIGSMITNGYIDELANSVLVSVDNNDADKNAALREKLNGIIRSLIATDTSEGAVISLQIDHTNTDAASLASELNITLGKAQLILDLCACNTKYDPAALAKLGINELSLILKGVGAEVNGEVNGTASDKAYIGEKKAKAVALEYISLSENDIDGIIDIELEHDDGIMLYEIELFTEMNKYEIEVNALSGDIVSCKKEERFYIHDALSRKYITEQAVRDIIAAYCPDTEKWAGFECELQTDDGIVVYEVELSYNGIDYEFELNAVTGDIICVETDRYNRDNVVNNDTPSNKGLIAKEDALNKVLERAGLGENDINGLTIELDRDDNLWKYEIEFRCGKYEYEAEVNADTGEIISYERDIDD